MKQWFPFTDYDFYAYITAGIFLVALGDYVFGGSTLLHRTQWSAVQIVFWAAVVYVAGQLVATPSAAIFEQWLARRVLRPPIDILLGVSPPRAVERAVNAMFVGHSYRPFPKQTINLLFNKASTIYGSDAANDAEAVFQAAYAAARQRPDVSLRLDQIQNIYGFSRNLACVALIAAVLLSARYFASPSSETLWFLLGSLLVLFGAFGRFLKFYSAFAQETLRAFGFQNLSAAGE